MICDRCLQETGAFTTSMFNTETICLKCKKIESEHPEYEKARDAELRAVQSGDYNFPGIGLPSDLRRSK